MHKKFEINWIKIKGGCQSGRKVVTHNSKSDLPLVNKEKKACYRIDSKEGIDIEIMMFYFCPKNVSLTFFPEQSVIGAVL